MGVYDAMRQKSIDWTKKDEGITSSIGVEKEGREEVNGNVIS